MKKLLFFIFSLIFLSSHAMQQKPVNNYTTNKTIKSFLEDASSKLGDESFWRLTTSSDYPFHKFFLTLQQRPALQSFTPYQLTTVNHRLIHQLLFNKKLDSKLRFNQITIEETAATIEGIFSSLLKNQG